MKTAGGAVITLAGEYPWKDTLTYTVEPDADEAFFTLALRRPGWCRTPEITVNGECCTAADLPEKDGYLLLARSWHKRDTVTVRLDLTPRRVYADPRVRSDAGCTAIMRGPVVYAFEGVDNGDVLQALRIPREEPLRELPYDPDLLGGVVPVEVRGRRKRSGAQLYAGQPPEEEPVTLRAIPYYAWCNRGITQMRVWMPE